MSQDLDNRLKVVETKTEILYSKQATFDIELEKTREVINKLHDLKSIITGASIVIPLCVGLLIWNVTRVIDFNDRIDEKQTQQIANMQLEYTKTIDDIKEEVDNIRGIIKKHFKED